MEDKNAVAEAQEAIEEDPSTAPAPEAQEDGSEAEQGTETPTERPSRAKDRIRELVAERRDAIKYAEMQRQRAADLEAQLKQRETPAETKTRPQLKEYETPEEWADAVTDWASDQATSRAAEHVEKTLSSRDSDASAQERAARFQQSMATAAEGHEDYWDVVLDETTYLPGNVVEVVQDFEQAGELTYYLATNPTAARQIASKTPTQIAAELARLEGKVTDKPTPKPGKTTRAPEPPSPVSGGPSADVDLSKLSTKDYIKQRRQQRKAG